VKPSDFLLGVLDFFAILLPGSLATWLATQYIPPSELREALSFGLEEGAATPGLFILVSAFVLSSFMLGHFVYMTSARLDVPYDWWRERTKPTDRDKAFKAARALHKELTGGIIGGEFTTLKWAKAYIQIKAPLARVEIDRLEADSKFFRSVVVVAVAFAAHFLLHEHSPAPGVAAVVMAVLSYRRFREQRWKMTELTYGTAVIVHATALPTAAPIA
jgi:hypothetical protein